MIPLQSNYRYLATYKLVVCFFNYIFQIEFLNIQIYFQYHGIYSNNCVSTPSHQKFIQFIITFGKKLS